FRNKGADLIRRVLEKVQRASPRSHAHTPEPRGSSFTFFTEISAFRTGSILAAPVYHHVPNTFGLDRSGPCRSRPPRIWRAARSRQLSHADRMDRARRSVGGRGYASLRALKLRLTVRTKNGLDG